MSLLPWEEAAASLPWQTGTTPVFNRIVSVTRPNVNAAVGQQSYAGLVTANETAIFTNISVAIQLKSAGRTLLTNLPSDARHQVEYVILIPASTAPFESLLIRDIVTDEQATRYQVFAATWTLFGYELSVTLLEV